MLSELAIVQEVREDSSLRLVDAQADRAWLEANLPYGPHALLLDRVEVRAGIITGLYSFRKERCDFFPDHFKRKAIMAGAMQLEMMMQAALAGLSLGASVRLVLARGINTAEFLHPVEDGAELGAIIYHWEKDGGGDDIYIGTGGITLRSTKILTCTAEFKASVRFRT